MIKFCNLKLKNPIFVASGIAGFGEEYFEIINLNILGGFITKTITLKPIKGNPPPRIIETPAGLINSIGLENLGLDAFLNEKLPWIEKNLKIPVFVSISGQTIDEYVKIVKALSNYKFIKAIELNLSCPNIKYKIKCFSHDAGLTYKIVKEVKKNIKLPVIAKLSPNVTDITEIALSAQKAGADALDLINSVSGMSFLPGMSFLSRVKARDKLQQESKKFLIGGLSGSCIKPIALRCIYEASKQVKIPIIGSGGISNINDVIEFFKAGAKFVAIGSAIFKNPNIVEEIIKEGKKLWQSWS